MANVKQVKWEKGEVKLVKGERATVKGEMGKVKPTPSHFHTLENNKY